jgi:hypothetical protein
MIEFLIVYTVALGLLGLLYWLGGLLAKGVQG